MKRSPSFDCACIVPHTVDVVKKNFGGLSPSFRPQPEGTTAVVLLSLCLTALAVYHILGTLSTVFLKKSFCCFCNSVFPSALDVRRGSSLPRCPMTCLCRSRHRGDLHRSRGLFPVARAVHHITISRNFYRSSNTKSDQKTA